MVTLRRILTLTLFLSFATACFAQAPTGTVSLYSDLNGNTCQPSVPASAGSPFATLTLDASGNYTDSLTVGTVPGSYPIYASYSGDASHNPSLACKIVVITNSLSNTVTTLNANPNPIQVGQVITYSGGVTNQ